MSRDALYWTLWPLLTLLFAVFYIVAYSVLMGVRENYYRYAQKAELQWTGPGRQTAAPRRPPLWKFLAGALLTTGLVLHLVIFR